MNKLIAFFLIFLTGCTVQLKDERIDPAKVENLFQVVQNQGLVLTDLIKVLQEKAILPKQEKKNEK